VQCITLKINIYKTIILPIVLFGFRTWSLTLGEKHVPEHKVLRKTFGHKRNKGKGEVVLVLNQLPHYEDISIA
jgi:hypothetical protein